MNDEFPPDAQSKYELRNAAAEEAMRGIARFIKQGLPEGYGFAVFVFNYGEGGAMFYMSSAERADMVKALREFIAKQEGAA